MDAKFRLSLSARYRESNSENKQVNTHNTVTLSHYQKLWDVMKNTKELWFYFRNLMNESGTEYSQQIVNDGYVTVSAPLNQLVQESEEERKEVIENMSKRVMKEIERKQNPEDCENARILVYDISPQTCGFGCNLHGIMIHFITAFVNNRTFILRDKGWHYSEDGWEYAFLPIGKCKDVNWTDLAYLTENSTAQRVLGMGGETEQWMHWSVPRELYYELIEVHDNPFGWWLAHFVWYLIRMQPWLETKLQEISNEIGFSESFVAIQIRWGDKLWHEANKYEVEEYMFFVERWFTQMEYLGKQVEKTIYVSTEEKLALEQLIENYPNYTFIASRYPTKRIFKKDRYNHDGLESVLTDIYFLQRSSYLVCTLSSNVCRTSYEMMIMRRVDTSTTFQSVDEHYRFRGKVRRNWVATMDHSPVTEDEIELLKDDIISVSLMPLQYTNNGYMRGTNTRTRLTGKFPAFKAREFLSYDKTLDI